MSWFGPVAVVTMPTEIDASNAASVREELLLVLNRGASVLVVDMTASAFCDCAGIGAVMRAFHRANASGAQVRLVSGGPMVQRIFGLIGIDRVIEVYPSLTEAISARPDARCTQVKDVAVEDCCQVPKGGG